MPKRTDFNPENERADLRPERPDLRPDRVDLRSQRPNQRPEINEWTNARMNKSRPVFYRTSSPLGPLHKNGSECCDLMLISSHT